MSEFYHDHDPDHNQHHQQQQQPRHDSIGNYGMEEQRQLLTSPEKQQQIVHPSGWVEHPNTSLTTAATTGKITAPPGGTEQAPPSPAGFSTDQHPPNALDSVKDHISHWKDSARYEFEHVKDKVLHRKDHH
jgi:hypothetical protein